MLLLLRNFVMQIVIVENLLVVVQVVVLREHVLVRLRWWLAEDSLGGSLVWWNLVIVEKFLFQSWLLVWLEYLICQHSVFKIEHRRSFIDLEFIEIVIIWKITDAHVVFFVLIVILWFSLVLFLFSILVFVFNLMDNMILVIVMLIYILGFFFIFFHLIQNVPYLGD